MSSRSEDGSKGSPTVRHLPCLVDLSLVLAAQHVGPAVDLRLLTGVFDFLRSIETITYIRLRGPSAGTLVVLALNVKFAYAQRDKGFMRQYQLQAERYRINCVAEVRDKIDIEPEACTLGDSGCTAIDPRAAPENGTRHYPCS